MTMLAINARRRPKRSATMPKRIPPSPRSQQRQRSKKAGNGRRDREVLEERADDERIQHHVEGVEHPSERCAEQRAACGRRTFLQPRERTERSHRFGVCRGRDLCHLIYTNYDESLSRRAKADGWSLHHEH
jgi:hypothetical protein